MNTEGAGTIRALRGGWVLLTAATCLAALLACKDGDEAPGAEGPGDAGGDGTALGMDDEATDDEGSEADARVFSDGQQHSTFDRKALQSTIKKGLVHHGVATTSVSCPASEPVKAGHRFDCTANCGGTNVKIGVQVKDAQGTIHWGAKDHLVDSSTFANEVRRSMEKSGHKIRSVTCHGKTWIASNGAEHQCDIKATDGSGWRYGVTFTGKGSEHTGKYFQTSWPTPPPAPPPAPPRPATNASGVPPIPRTRSNPPTIAEWRSASLVNTQGASSRPPGCYMKVVREWLKVHCEGYLQKVTHLKNFGRHKVDYFYHLRKNKVADFVVRIRPGNMGVRMWMHGYRATLFTNWYGGDRPKHLALGICRSNWPCWHK